MVLNVEFPFDALAKNEHLIRELLNLTGMHFRTIYLRHSLLFNYVGSSCPNLIHVEVDNCTADASFGAVIAGCPLLESLKFGSSKNENVWFGGMLCPPKLSTLEAHYVSDALYFALSKYCPNRKKYACNFGAVKFKTYGAADRANGEKLSKYQRNVLAQINGRN